MAIITSTFASGVLMANPEFYKSMFERTGKHNLAFEEEVENVENELNEKEQMKYSAARAANVVQTLDPELGEETNVSKRISFTEGNSQVTGIKLYKKRFWILTLYSVSSMLNGMQWMQYTVVSETTSCFYGVDLDSVNWTANLYLVLYAPLVFPISWFTEKMGIRNSLLVGTFLTCLGTAIQCMATTPDSFNLVLASQAVSSVAQIFIVALPPDISATWFGADELSRASAVGVFGNQLGSGLGFIFTPLVMSTDCNRKDLIAHGRRIVAYTLVSCNLLVFLLILATFDVKPKTPPSLAQAKKTDIAKDYKRSICALLRNVHYDLLLIAFGIIAGISFGIGTILFSLVAVHFPGKNTEIGSMGLIAIFCGTVGSIIAGYILDRNHRYKEMSIAIFAFSFACTILFAAVLYVDIMWLQFITIGILGFFMSSYIPIGLEFAVEITYPEPEAISATLLIASTTIMGLLMAEIGSYLVQNYSDIAANGFFCASLLLGTVVICVIKCDYRRQKQKN